LHDDIIKRYGSNSGIRDLGLLEAAVAQPSLFVFGSFIHPDIFQMAGAYAYHIIKNHPFVETSGQVFYLRLRFSKKMKLQLKQTLI